MPRPRACAALGQPVDDFVIAAVLEKLSRPDAHLLLDTPVDIGDLQARRVAIQARLDELAGLFAEGAIDASQLRKGSTALRSKVAVIDSELADATRTSPVAALIASGEKLFERWGEMSVTQRAQAVDELAVVTVLPCPKGLRSFSSDYIQIEWKTEAD